MKHFFTLLATVLITASTFAQVGIGTVNPDTSAALEIESTTGGILIPRLTETQRDAISVPATGLMVYQTDGTAGFYYYNGSSWTVIGAADKTYTVNTFYAELGDYVIEVRDEGKHGLVLAMQDQGSYTWYVADDSLNNPDYHNVDGDKFMDWRLPTKRELNLIYGIYASGNAVNLSAAAYWSSSDISNDSAWELYFVNGTGGNYSKNNTVKTRAVRAF